MKKNYVLDTNILLHDPKAIFRFEDNTVVIPIHVIEEIDQFKKDMNELGRNARMVARYLDDLREQSGGSLQIGVEIENGGKLRVAVPGAQLPTLNMLEGAVMDNAIISCALFIRDENKKIPTIFVTMDTNLRIRADALGLKSENYEGARISIDELYTGFYEFVVSKEIVDQLGGRQDVSVELVPIFDEPKRFPNACVVLKDESNESHTAIGRYDAASQAIKPLSVVREGVWGIKPKNREQWFALELLLNPEINLVTLVGKAGTGKTLLAVAAGLRKVLDEGRYSRLVVSRPVFPLGRDIGFLPGDIDEKLNPWMQPIFDNLEFIFSMGKNRPVEGRTYQELVASGMVQVEPLTYIRGRSLPNQFLIVDEAQNLTPHEVKTIVTRCGNDTKVILTGDPYQIDNPYVDSASNGLSIVAERFKQEKISGHLTLLKGERSELAERATQLL